MLQNFIATASWLSLARINAAFGSNAVAGYSLAIRIISVRVDAVMGHLLGGRDSGGPEPRRETAGRSERAVWLAGLYNMGFLTVVRRGLSSPRRAHCGLVPPRRTGGADRRDVPPIVSLGYPFYAWGMVMEHPSMAPVMPHAQWIDFSCYWCVQIPLAWYLKPAHRVRVTYILPICGAESVLAVVRYVCPARKMENIAV